MLTIDSLLRNLLNWLARHGLASYDFADALQSPVLRSLTSRSQLAQCLALQLVKRSPINVRPLLGISPHLSSQTLALVCSTHAWQHFAGWRGVTEQTVEEAAKALIQDRLDAGEIYLWGLKLYWSSRFGQCDPSTPNLFQTCNAIHALLDAYQVTGDAQFADTAAKAVHSCYIQLGIVNSAAGHYCRYYPNADTPVYNVNALFAAACLRLSCLGIGTVSINRERSEELLAFVLKGQRSDGSWPYAADRAGQWVDGFHTGYILEALGYFLHSPLRALIHDPVKAGVAFFECFLIDRDGCPKYYADSRYPIDVQNCAQAIQTTARLLPLFGANKQLLERVIASVVEQLYIAEATDSGYFAANRTRWFMKKIPYVRWGQAPMVLALTHAWNALRDGNTFFEMSTIGNTRCV